MKKSLIAAGAASVALAAMPVVGVFAADIQSVTDTINVTVNASCTFAEGTVNATYAASGTNGTPVNPVTGSEPATNVRSFNVFCNRNSGYTVSATASDLTQGGVNDKFAYKATLPESGADGAWHATIAGTGVTNQLPDSAVPEEGQAPVATATIVSRNEASGTGGENFTATYSAYIGAETPAGLYTGTISYTLAPGA